MTTSSSKYNVSDSMRSFRTLILRQMNMVFEREVNVMADRYAEEMKRRLLKVVADYMVKIHDKYDECNNETKVTVEVTWPNGETTNETEDSDAEVGPVML